MCFNLIYKLVNTVNNKIYVGQTWGTLKERWDYGLGYKSCRYLQLAIDKYGKENFRYEVLTITHTQEIADYWECYFIDKYDSRNPDVGYNLRGGGSRGKFHHTEETKKKISKAKTGKKMLEEHRAKISAKLLGTLNPNYGKEKTKEQLEKQSRSMSGKNNPHYGKPRPAETRYKISIAQSGEKSSKAKLTKKDIIDIIQLLKSGYSHRQVANIFKVSPSTINKIHLKKSWKDIER